MIEKFIIKRILLFKEKDVRGEILLNIGLGIFVNSLYSLTQKEISIYIVLDVIFGIMMIIEGSIMKKDNRCKKRSL